jgi:hypothetical protein
MHEAVLGAPEGLLKNDASPPTCVPLDSIGDAEAGGKARGLARLIELGLRVPSGFVILGASQHRTKWVLRPR